MAARLALLASALIVVLGCRRGDEMPPPPDLEPLAAWEETADAFNPLTLDYACLGTRTRPAGGELVSTTFQLRDFEDDFAVDSTMVWLFTNNEIGDACDAPNCQAFTTDASGNATVQLPANGWYAYRVHPKSGLSRMTTVFSVFQYNEPAPATTGGSVTGNSVSGSTIEVIPAVLGISRTPGLAIVAGRIEDCNGGFVQNAQIVIYDADGNEIVEGPANDNPHYHYFSGTIGTNLPNQTQTESNRDGLYVAVQIPVADERPYRVEAWGILDGSFQRLSCETARIFPDAVTILNMGPLREDAPAACL